MNALFDILFVALNMINMLVLIWVVLSLLFAFNIIGHSNQFLWSVYDSLSRLFEPVLRPIRRIMPDTGQMDFSPMVFLFLLFIIGRVLSGVAAGYA
ncbi:YggT family protein [Pseudoblastomonas halimionae]|uniref:YggT family protein n=1 Tax=Alteriqipengyuania halimionae TaxID=1926630 RepID=A0A6I4U8H5_9SPHN|nr:YggT family protein [Alteriqipengyuania halimionae]MXP11105.1 YggT family protein [Alteriqipengyuania halimionae]